MPGSGRVRMALLIGAMAALVAAVSPARAADLLADAGGGIYEIRQTTLGDDDQPLYETRARLRIDALEAGAWRVRLLSAEIFDRFFGRWTEVIVDSVDPRARDLPDGVLIEFVVDGAPDLTALIPEDIPSVAFGLLLEATTLLALCSEEGGLDRLDAPGDSTTIDGFVMHWSRPHGVPANRRVMRSGEAVFQSEENGVATVAIRPQGLRWMMVRGYDDFRLSLGREDYPVTLRIDAATGALQSASVDRSVLVITEIGETPDATLPERDDIDIPPGAQSYTTRRSVELERLDDSD